MRLELCDGRRRGCSSSIWLIEEGGGLRTRRWNVRVPQRTCGRKRWRCSSPLRWACGDACGARGVGVSILSSEDDGVVAGIGGREGPKLPTIAVTPGWLVAN